jgi:dolichyl-phosphate-mannose-protein mannosyltransferase
MSPKKAEQLWTWHGMAYLGFIAVVAYFVYVFNYTNPPYLFWDENYFLAAAQKYLNGVFFMEPHPPLAKLFIALGEYLVNANPIDNSFVGTDYGRQLLPGFSFAGYRLFPVLFAWGGALLFYLIMLLISRKHMLAVLFSFFYLFDNALIVHFRGAMLDSTMIFFALLAILGFLLALEWKDDIKKIQWAAIIYGIGLGGTAATKVLGIIVLLLAPALLWIIWKNRPLCKQVFLYAFIPFCLVYGSAWYAHFALGKTIQKTLPDQGYYQASESYKNVLTEGKTASLQYFPLMLRDSWNFLSHYSKGVPHLDLCKPDENGSPWFMWPFGGRTINYRWETPDGDRYQYLYLQGNPVTWGLGLVGIIFSIALVLSWLFLPIRKSPHNIYLITVFLWMYLSYMFTMANLDRVMYLYHYFIPLIFSYILFALIYGEIDRIGPLKLSAAKKANILIVIAVLVFISFEVYRPLSYYEPLSDRGMQLRSLTKYWDLRCVNCPREYPIARPRGK